MDDLERLYELLYLLPVGVVSFGDDGSVESANPLSVQFLNPFVEPKDTANAFSFLAPLAPDLADEIVAHPVGSVVIAHRRTTLAAVDTPAMTVELSVHRPRPGYYVAVLSDVSELVRREHELRRERDRIRIIVEMVHDYAIYSLDRDGIVDSWNASGERLFGLSVEQAVGRTLAEIVDVANLVDALDAAIFAGWYRVEGWALMGPSGPFYTDTMISTLLDENGRPEGFIVITRDATELRRREEELRREADTDPLTQLANRRGFDVRAHRLLAACAANGSPASLLMIDIDHFKSINDTYGHDGGDVVLCAVAAGVRDQLRAIDLIARLGGEEFAVLLPGADGVSSAQRANALRAAVESLDIPLDSSTSVSVTISVGVAAHDGDLAGTLQRADAAMYVAKQSGRNRVVSDGEADNLVPQ